MPNEIHIIGGQRYRALAESTVERDWTFMGLLRSTGLDQVQMYPDESPEVFARRLMGDILASGKALAILGCLFVPDGMADSDWTPEIGRQTASYFGRLVQPEDKEAANQILLGAYLGFLAQGLVSLTTSQTSSDGANAAPTMSAASPAPTTIASDVGAPSSARSPDMTSSARSASLGGRSGRLSSPSVSGPGRPPSVLTSWRRWFTRFSLRGRRRAA